MMKLASIACLRTALENRSSPAAIRSYLGAVGVAAALLGGNSAADAQGMPMPPPPPTLLGPSMDGPISANPTPFVADLGFLGNQVYVGGVLSGIAWAQDNNTCGLKNSYCGDDYYYGGVYPGNNDYSAGLDISNAQVFVQKTDGMFQYYIQAGGYALPALGTTFTRATSTAPLTYGYVPVAFVKFVPTDTFSIEAGKLPTLVGAEYTFTFQNMNIIRGLLWNQEPAISQGVQANLTTGPLAWSVSLNDGYYSNRYNWISGSVAWTIDMADTLSFIGAGNMGQTGYSYSGDTGVPAAQNNGSIFNLIYTHSDGAWVITGYAQYEETPGYKTCYEGSGSTCEEAYKYGIASSWGGAILASYSFNDNWKLAGRVEYITASANSAPASGYVGSTYVVGSQTNLLGFTNPNGSAWSFTVTPTYQYKNFYVRAEYSLVDVSSGVGYLGSPEHESTTQNRGLLEVGVMY